MYRLYEKGIQGYTPNSFSNDDVDKKIMFPFFR